MQTRALADCGADVTLYACRSVSDERDLPAAIARQYGITTDGIRLKTTFARSTRALNVRIAFLAVRRLLSARWPDLVICRNLYAAYILGVLMRRPLVFELHHIENGSRGLLQRAILRQPGVRIVSISQKLLEFVAKAYGITPSRPQVLRDAAPSGIAPVPRERRRAQLQALVPAAQAPWHGVCGYIGHLYAGRGVELIEALAERRPDVLFLLAGGHETDISARQARNRRKNLVFVGHLPHHSALELAKCVDVLLMPYQRSVSLGVGRYDTAQWMSPMKMFEYMATDVPIVSSDLPVLHEVLQDGENALLVPPDAVDTWAEAIDRLLTDSDLSCSLARKAYSQYEAQHTWGHRARALLAAS
jgi:glycosyltransferase involved in cell wall biosynthesis